MNDKGWTDRLTEQMTEKHKKGEAFTDHDWINFCQTEIANAHAEEAERCAEHEKKAREEERERLMRLISTHTEHEGSYCDTGEDMEWACRSDCVRLALERITRE